MRPNQILTLQTIIFPMWCVRNQATPTEAMSENTRNGWAGEEQKIEIAIEELN
jgi:hypothetical protein